MPLAPAWASDRPQVPTAGRAARAAEIPSASPMEVPYLDRLVRSGSAECWRVDQVYHASSHWRVHMHREAATEGWAQIQLLTGRLGALPAM